MPQSTAAEETEFVISYADEFHQTIKVRARAGQAAHLLIEEIPENSVPIGGKPPAILVRFTDALNNVVEDINDFLPLLCLAADGLDTSQLTRKKMTLAREKIVRLWFLYEYYAYSYEYMPRFLYVLVVCSIHFILLTHYFLLTKYSLPSL